MRTCARTTLGGVHFGEFDVQHFGLCRYHVNRGLSIVTFSYLV